MRVVHVGVADVLDHEADPRRGRHARHPRRGRRRHARRQRTCRRRHADGLPRPDRRSAQGRRRANLISGADTLIGSPFNDVLDGGLGNDRSPAAPASTCSSTPAAATRWSRRRTSTCGCSRTRSSLATIRSNDGSSGGSSVNGYTRRAQLDRRSCERRRPELPHHGDGDRYGRRRDGREHQGPLREGDPDRRHRQQHARRQRLRQHRLHRRRPAHRHAVAGPATLDNRGNRRAHSRVRRELRDHDHPRQRTRGSRSSTRGGGSGVDERRRLRHQPGRRHRAERGRQRRLPRRHRRRARAPRRRGSPSAGVERVSRSTRSAAPTACSPTTPPS